MRLCVIVTFLLMLTAFATFQRSEATLVSQVEAVAGLSSEAFGGLSVVDRHTASDRASAHVVPGFRVGPGSADAVAEFGGGVSSQLGSLGIFVEAAGPVAAGAGASLRDILTVTSGAVQCDAPIPIGRPCTKNGHVVDSFATLNVSLTGSLPAGELTGGDVSVDYQGLLEGLPIADCPPDPTDQTLCAVVPGRYVPLNRPGGFTSFRLLLGTYGVVVTLSGDAIEHGFIDYLHTATVSIVLPPGSDLTVTSASGLFLTSTPIADNTPPTTTMTLAPKPNASGWNKTSVTVALNATDNSGGSGVKEIQFSLSGAQPGAGLVGGSAASVPIAAEGTTTLTYFARDNANNAEAPKTLPVQIDKTPPTVTFASPTPSPNAAGWNNGNVSIAFAAADSLSGLAATTPSNPLVLTTEGRGVTQTVTVADLAGNSATFTSPAVNIDKTPPAVTCSVSPNVLWPPNHKMVTVKAAVDVSDSLSGPGGFTLIAVTSNEPIEAGDIEAFALGTPAATGQLRADRFGGGSGRVYTLTYQGVDIAGNSALCSTTVTVPHDQR